LKAKENDRDVGQRSRENKCLRRDTTLESENEGNEESVQQQNDKCHPAKRHRLATLDSSSVDTDGDAVDTDGASVVGVVAAYGLRFTGSSRSSTNDADGGATDTNRDSETLDGNVDTVQEAESSQGRKEAIEVGAVGVLDVVTALNGSRVARRSLARGQGSRKSGRGGENDDGEFGEHIMQLVFCC
jgi:hypothetical protein